MILLDCVLQIEQLLVNLAEERKKERERRRKGRRKAGKERGMLPGFPVRDRERKAPVALQ